jgi:hypothetical protein
MYSNSVDMYRCYIYTLTDDKHLVCAAVRPRVQQGHTAAVNCSKATATDTDQHIHISSKAGERQDGGGCTALTNSIQCQQPDSQLSQSCALAPRAGRSSTRFEFCTDLSAARPTALCSNCFWRASACGVGGLGAARGLLGARVM